MFFNNHCSIFTIYVLEYENFSIIMKNFKKNNKFFFYLQTCVLFGESNELNEFHIRVNDILSRSARSTNNEFYDGRTDLSRICGPFYILCQNYQNLRFLRSTPRNYHIHSSSSTDSLLDKTSVGTTSSSDRHQTNGATTSKIIKIVQRVPRQLQQTIQASQRKPKAQDYDHCSHPFHAWMCQKSSNRKSGTLSFPDVSVPSKGKQLFSDPTNIRRGNLLLSEPQTTIKPMEKKAYDKCNHPFHSWLCQKPKGKSLSSGNALFSDAVQALPSTTPPTTTPFNICDNPLFASQCTTSTTPSGKSLFPESSNHRKGSELFADPSFTSTTTVKPPPKSKAYDKCSHPFHSWLCEKPTRNRGKSISDALPSNTLPKNTNTRKGSEIFPEVVTTPSPPKTTPLNKCNHPFLSWMCDEPKPNSNIRKGSELFSDPIFTTTTTKKPEAKSASGSLPDVVRPKMMKGAPKYDKCSHSFHSWLCAVGRKKSPPRSGSILFSEPSNIRKGSDSLPDSIPNPITNPPTTTTTTTTTQSPSTTRAPEIQQPIDCNNPLNAHLCPKPHRKDSELFSEPTFQKPKSTGKALLKMKPKWDMTDPCNHAFHSWLCQNKKPSRSFGKSIPRGNLNFPVNLPPPITTTPSPSTIRRGSLLDSEPQTTTIPPTIPPTTPKPKKISDTIFSSGSFQSPDSIKRGKDISSSPQTTMMPKKYDKCSHSFHTWLCNYFLKDSKIRLPTGSESVLVKKKAIPNIQSLPLAGESFTDSRFIRSPSNQFIPQAVIPTNSNFKVIHENS